MPHRTVYFNGKYVPESEARVSIFDSALMFGDMAFEMTRTFRPAALPVASALGAALRLITVVGDRLRIINR